MEDLQKIIERLDRLEIFLGIDNQMSAQEARQLEAIKKDGIKALKYYNKIHIADGEKTGKPDKRKA